MSYHRLGKTDKSREYYDRAVRRQQRMTLLPDETEELNAFRAEVDALLGPSAQP